MRNIKECLRLKLEAGLSHEKIARALQLSKGVVSKYVTAARVAGLDWPALAAMDEAALAAALFPPASPGKPRGERVLPDVLSIHRELRRKGVTLQLLWEEYLAALLAETDITVNAKNSASGCMSLPGDADCTAIMNRLGLPFEGKSSSGQKWIRGE